MDRTGELEWQAEGKKKRQLTVTIRQIRLHGRFSLQKVPEHVQCHCPHLRRHTG
jgi:hypothetical protein